MKEEPIFKFEKNIHRIFMWIVIFTINILIFFFLIYCNKSPKYLFIFNVIILVLIFITDIGRGIKGVSQMQMKDKDVFLNSSLYIKNFTYHMHLFFTYSGFIYIALFLYILFLVYKRRLDRGGVIYVVIMGVIGLFFVFKETFLQFSQCLYSGFSDVHRNKRNYGYWKCDEEYHKYWKCIQF